MKWPFSKQVEPKKEYKKPYEVTINKIDKPWTEDDAASLLAFCNSRSGRKWINIQETAVHNMCLQASPRTDTVDGIRIGLILALESLVDYSTIEEKNTDDDGGMYVLNSDFIDGGDE